MTTAMLTPGQKVKYRNPLDEGELGTFEVTNYNEVTDRAYIKACDDPSYIVPQFLIEASELEAVTE